MTGFQTPIDYFPSITRLYCPTCSVAMALMDIEPDKVDHERRTFQCPKCDHVERVVVKYM
jgi:hypothetical protein